MGPMDHALSSIFASDTVRTDIARSPTGMHGDSHISGGHTLTSIAWLPDIPDKFPGGHLQIFSQWKVMTHFSAF